MFLGPHARRDSARGALYHYARICGSWRDARAVVHGYQHYVIRGATLREAAVLRLLDLTRASESMLSESARIARIGRILQTVRR